MLLHDEPEAPRNEHDQPPAPDAFAASMPRRGPGRPPDLRPILPLSEDERALLDRALRRIHEQLKSFVAMMPPGADHASGMARFLDIERTTCQRVVSSVEGPFGGLELISRLPGSRGLKMLTRAARRRLPKDKHERIGAVAAGIELYETTVRRLAGSQSRLLRRLDASSTPAREGLDTASHDAARRAMFDAAAAVTGRWSELWLAAYLYRPHESDDRLLRHARVNGLMRHEWRADAVPLTFHSFNNNRNTPEDDADEAMARAGVFEPLVAREEEPAHLLEEFSAKPVPIVASKQTSEYMVQAIDAITDSSASWRPVDLMFGSRAVVKNPMRMSPRIEECWGLVNLPARAMVFDVFLHQDIALRCIPGLDAHLWRPDFASTVGDRWQTRLGNTPALTLLGRGLERIDSRWHPRHAELLSALFDAEGANPGDYVGFRCAVEHPLWRCGYCMSFDFGATGDHPR